MRVKCHCNVNALRLALNTGQCEVIGKAHQSVESVFDRSAVPSTVSIHSCGNFVVALIDFRVDLKVFAYRYSLGNELLRLHCSVWSEFTDVVFFNFFNVSSNEDTRAISSAKNGLA